MPRSPRQTGKPGHEAPRRAALRRFGPSRHAWLGLALLVLLAAALLAFRAWPQPVLRETGQNVLLITIDTLRADALGAYGNTMVSTPWVDKLAAVGVRFDQAHAQNVITLPSHANILSGRNPLDHGVRENAGFRFPARTDTLATLLKAHGYRTGAFVSAFPLDSRFGLARGFDVYDDAYGDSESHTAFRIQERRGSATVAAAAKWLTSTAREPFFCWVHLYDPHFPYAPPEPFASPFKDNPYYGDVSAADAALAPLISSPGLRARARRRPTRCGISTGSSSPTRRRAAHRPRISTSMRSTRLRSALAATI